MENYVQTTNNSIWLKALAVFCITAVVITSLVVTGRKDEVRHEFSISATGKVTAKPDIAQLTVGVYTDAKKTAALAVNDNTKKMNEIIKALKGIDIDKKDIETSNYSLNPVYDWTDKSGRQLRGYEVRQTVTMKIRNLDNIGKAIQVTAGEGANQIGGISFTIDDPEDLKQEARKIAIEKAKEKAKELSRDSGLRIGKLLNVYESQSYYPEMRISKAYAMDEVLGMGGGVPEPMIETGEEEVTVQMTLVYKVK